MLQKLRRKVTKTNFKKPNFSHPLSYLYYHGALTITIMLKGTILCIPTFLFINDL